MTAARWSAALLVRPSLLEQERLSHRLLTWCSLWWQGRVDARRGLPAVHDDADVLVTTPQLEALTRLAQELFEFERLSLVGDVAALRVRRIDLEHQAAELRTTLSLAETQRPDVNRPRDEDLTRRRAGEESLDTAVVQRRRRREHEREAVWHRQELQDLRDQLRSVQAEASATPTRIAQREREAVARVQHISEGARMWMAVYWRALMRRHPRRHALNQSWLPLPAPTASWAADLSGDERQRTDVRGGTGSISVKGGAQ